tara:strand:- start:34 stop:486 length:453 start_codon:yes stop_codon:yes gene_type:complete
VLIDFVQDLKLLLWISVFSLTSLFFSFFFFLFCSFSFFLPFFFSLENYCSPSVGKYEDGNTLSYDDFQQYINEHLNELGLDVPIDVQVQIMPKIKTMVVDAILAAKNNTTTMKDGIMEGQHPTRKSFELFGYDFMIDEDFRPWLIEVNTK